MIRLHIEQLTKRYNSQTVLDRLTVASSAPVLGISGANGSGKSTLLKCLAGLLRPSGGIITWSIGKLNVTPAEAIGRIGFAAPYVELYEAMSVEENLRFLLELKRGGPGPASNERITELLKRFQAAGYSDRPYGELSTGQRQRVKLAAACLHDPPLLCLDEPGSNLDEEGRLLIRHTLDFYSGRGRMIVLASNRPDELELCDEIVDLDQPHHTSTPSDS